MVRLRPFPSYSSPLTSHDIPILSHADPSPFYSAVKHSASLSSMLHGVELPATQLLKSKILTSCLYFWPGF